MDKTRAIEARGGGDAGTSLTTSNEEIALQAPCAQRIPAARGHPPRRRFSSWHLSLLLFSLRLLQSLMTGNFSSLHAVRENFGSFPTSPMLSYSHRKKANYYLLPLYDFEYSFPVLFELFQSDSGYQKQILRSGCALACELAKGSIAENYVGRHASLPCKLEAKFA